MPSLVSTPAHTFLVEPQYYTIVVGFNCTNIVPTPAHTFMLRRLLDDQYKNRGFPQNRKCSGKVVHIDNYRVMNDIQ